MPAGGDVVERGEHARTISRGAGLNAVRGARRGDAATGGQNDIGRSQDDSGKVELLVTAHIRGTTVVVATHDPMLLESGRRRVVRLEDGRIVHDAPAFSSTSSAPLMTLASVTGGVGGGGGGERAA